MDEDTAIKVQGVYKNFRLPHEKNNSLKTLFVRAGKKKNKGYEVQHALKDISFEVKKGEFFGIVGRNGSGKSTLLKILAEIYQPTKGKLRRNGKLVPFIELGVGFNPELTGRENVYLNGALLGFSIKEIDVIYDDIVQFAELERFMDQKLKNYSSGMQVRLAFSVATILANSDILLIDEVLAVGDSAFQKKCFAYFRQLKAAKKTVIFVSHDMNAVQEYCDRAVLIEDSEIVLEGSPSRISNAYLRMFTDEKLKNKEDLKAENPRWGSGEMKFENARISTEVISDEASLTISVTTKCLEKIPGEAVIGFKLKDAEGRPMFGTNTKLKKIDIKPTINQLVSVEWEFPVLFNDGNYFIDLEISDETYSETYDHWEDAISITVKRNEQSSYAINPLIITRLIHEK